MCSTPFGITEFRMRHERSGGVRHGACSTPFGITEFRILAAGLNEMVDAVLNAFRHH